jgi:fructoselysine-6-P-deglycase FrlB-like protein
MNEMMAREIAAQPELLLSIQSELAQICDGLPRPSGRIFAGGCGDSAFAPKALAGVFRRMGMPIAACSSMDLVGFVDLEPSDTIILSSISGGTKRSIEAARVASERGARVIGVTCNGESALAALADQTVVLPFKPLSRKTPHTLDYAVTLLALVEIARSFARLPSDATRSVLHGLPMSLTDAETEASEVAASWQNESRLFLLGAGPGLGTAEYGAAKFHEAGGLVAIAAETENFVHGMNFMLEPADLLVVLGGSDVADRRGREVVTAFTELVSKAYLQVPPDGSPSWQAAFGSVLQQTFFLQSLCLRVADHLRLTLEEPRAGRSLGAVHFAAQSSVMAS